ncbi:MAG: T9SS type A sorting domain-containing protein [Rhodothermaceae bacterium]|nr:T9SS type A sorting domain-containing protein [Rhodothermaceae bacterium]
MCFKKTLWVGVVVLLLAPHSSLFTLAQSNNTTAQIEMTCFPPPPQPGDEPGTGSPPPCVLPVGIGDEFISPSPSGTLNLKVNNNTNTAVFNIRLEGLSPDLVLTAWTSYFFPGGPAPHPIFEPLGEGLPAIAGVSAPLAPTYAGFTEGLGPEPNQFEITRSGNAKLSVELDYNPLLAGQGPLRNELVNTTQAGAPVGSEAEQPLCCPDGIPAPSLQAVGSSFIRSFDLDTGFQNLDEDGRPVLIRSPLPVAFIALVVHVDKTTHGINPGIPILPIPGLSVTTGDHFLLGIFDLREYHVEHSASSASLTPSNDQAFQLEGVYPNPFNPSTSFQLTVQKSQWVRIDVYDISGRLVRRLFNETLEENQPKLFAFSAENLASGRYLLQINGEHFSSTRPLILSK